MYISRELFLKMSVADLAIDVGIPKDSDEYDSFIGCVENILEYGCGYGDSFTEKIIEKCRSSQLDIAKKVISELERPKSRYRQKKLKWWQEWQPKTHSNKHYRRSPQNERHSSKRRSRRPSQHERRGPKKPMSPLFERRRRPMELDFRKRAPPPRKHYYAEPRNERRVRKRSPSPEYERHGRYRRSMSPMFSENADVPKWPGRSPEYRPQHKKSSKRRRFR